MNAKQTKLYEATAEKIKLSDGSAREIAILVDAREYAIRRGISLDKAEAIIRQNIELIENGDHAYVGTVQFGVISVQQRDQSYEIRGGLLRALKKLAEERSNDIDTVSLTQLMNDLIFEEWERKHPNMMFPDVNGDVIQLECTPSPLKS